MTKMTERLIKARKDMPDELRGVTFDAWLLPLIIETLEPVQRDFIEWLVLVKPEKPLCTSDLCEAVGTTLERAGAALSDLRRLRLVETTHMTDKHGKTAYHIAVKWVRQAYAMLLQRDKEMLQELMNTPLPPVYGRRRVHPIDE